MKTLTLIAITASLLSGCAAMTNRSLGAVDINSQFPGKTLTIEASNEAYYFIPDGLLVYRNKERKETRAGTWFMHPVMIRGARDEALCVPSGRTGNTKYSNMRCFQFTDSDIVMTASGRQFDTIVLSCDGSKAEGINCRKVGFTFSALHKSEVNDDIQGRFEVKNKLTVVDSKTGLTWMKCTLGQDSTPIEPCETPPVKFRKGFEQINAYIKDFNRKGYAGHNDWRLPSYDELSSLIWCGVETTPKDGESCDTLLGDKKTKSPSSWNVFSTERWLYASASQSHKLFEGGSIARPKKDKVMTFGAVNFNVGYRGWLLYQELFDPRWDHKYVLVRLVRGGKHER